MALTETGLIEGHDYTFKQLRQYLKMMAGVVQEGVIGATDYATTAGALMTVNVAAGDAIVQMDSGVGNGYYMQSNDAVVNVAVGAAHGTLPRLDQLVLQVRDPNVAGAFDTAQLYVLAGVATAGTTLDNRNGATALPVDHIRLADILVPAASSSISGGNVRDRRPWARGAHLYVKSAGGGSVSTASGTELSLSALLGTPRVELSGGPVEAIYNANMSNSSAATNMWLRLYIDGGSISAQLETAAVANAVDTLNQHELLDWGGVVGTPPPAGSHVMDLRIYGNAGGTISMVNDVNQRARLMLREVGRPLLTNG